MLEVDFTWSSTGTSGGLAAVHVQAAVRDSVLYCHHSTLASTQSFGFQTAIASTGPWYTEGTGAVSTALNGLVAVRVTGPYVFMRPYLNSASTGTYTFRLLGKT